MRLSSQELGNSRLRDIGDNVLVMNKARRQARNRFEFILSDIATNRSCDCCDEMRSMTFLDPSAFVGTNPAGELITFRFPVILPQLHETMFADLLQSLLRSSNQGHSTLLQSATS